MRKFIHRRAWCSVVCLAATLPAGSQTAPPAPGPVFTVVLDAAHGKGDPGVTLNPTLLEKNIVLELSIRLRSALNARGIAVQTTRESDTDPSPNDRAAIANHARAGACLLLHATSSGSGVHLYTSSQAASAPLPPGSPQPWKSAGAAHSVSSLKLASDMEAAMSSAGIPFTQGRVRMEPLDAMGCPAVAVEVAPLRPISGNRGVGNAGLDDPNYQARLVDALAAALVQWRSESEKPE